ncbi:MAG TPA: hypothetical protein VNE82_06600 [Candidatus Binataceae bacterium]|nr:hypothetical protein [Candidatus Binataceae bacterium]
MELKNGVLERVRKLTNGQTMTEYSLIVLFVGLAAFSAYSEIGLEIKVVASNLISFLATAISAL